LKLVVDEQERIQNPDPNRIYSSLRQEHLAALHAGVLPAAVMVRLMCCCASRVCRIVPFWQGIHACTALQLGHPRLERHE
jgi:hypothetical protein